MGSTPTTQAVVTHNVIRPKRLFFNLLGDVPDVIELDMLAELEENLSDRVGVRFSKVKSDKTPTESNNLSVQPGGSKSCHDST